MVEYIYILLLGFQLTVATDSLSCDSRLSICYTYKGASVGNKVQSIGSTSTGYERHSQTKSLARFLFLSLSLSLSSSLALAFADLFPTDSVP
uniref:Secreted protein n=1 Tax=Anopheles darlingi TaxID=43151 RepID=A0A2M4DCT2_ANODA